MVKPKDHRKPKRNPREESLRGTPFTDPGERDRALREIRLDVWREWAAAQVVEELRTKKEFDFMQQEWEAGLVCVFGGKESQEIYRIFSPGRGLRLELKQQTVESLGEGKADFLSAVVRSGIEGYGSLFLKMKRMIGSESGSSELVSSIKDTQESS